MIKKVTKIYELLTEFLDSRREADLFLLNSLARLRFKAKRWRFLWSIMGVTRRWILGALNWAFLPSLTGKGLLITYWHTLSSLLKLKSLRILEARLGPKRRGTVVSVRPGISFSPFFVMTT